MSVLLEVENLQVELPTQNGPLRAVRGIDFHVERGEMLCLVGESGCGKSMTSLALMGLLPRRAKRQATRLRFDGVDLQALDDRGMAKLRGNRMAMIFQEPMTSLNPVLTVGEQVAEVLRRHRGMNRRAALVEAINLLRLVEIPAAERRVDDYPHQLSGGQRQRAMIAIALACRPKLLIADEPTTALDATVQIQVLLLLRELQRELGLAVIFVTHDIGVAVEVADRIAVMYGGRIVEMGRCGDVIRGPAHPYTQGLLASRAGHSVAKGARLAAIPGSPPDLANLPPGCAFAPRCSQAIEACRNTVR